MATISRVVGSGFTTLAFNGKTIALLDSFRDSGQPVAFGPETVYSIGNGFPDEIVTSRVVGPGTLDCTIREVWHEPIWKYLLGLGGVDKATAAAMNNIVDAYRAMDALPELTAQMIIQNPNKGGGHRGKVYHNLTITALDDGETVTVGALSVARTVTFMYTKATHFTGAANTAIPTV